MDCWLTDWLTVTDWLGLRNGFRILLQDFIERTKTTSVNPGDSLAAHCLPPEQVSLHSRKAALALSVCTENAIFYLVTAEKLLWQRCTYSKPIQLDKFLLEKQPGGGETIERRSYSCNEMHNRGCVPYTTEKYTWKDLSFWGRDGAGLIPSLRFTWWHS